MLRIHNAKLVFERGIEYDGAVLISEGRILACGADGEVPCPNGTESFDAQCCYLGPGFVDIHVHGGGGGFLYEDPVKTSAHFLRHGETTLLAALYYDLTKSRFLDSISLVREAVESGKAPNLAGFYMEGPYMNPDFGALREKNAWRGPIRAEDYRQIVDAAGSYAKVWAVAPEREGLEPFMRYAREVNPNVRFSVGHSMATPEQIESLNRFGFTLMTHTMDATGRAPHYAGTRGAGPDEYCLSEPEMYAELISDSMGIHVNPTLQRMILRAKGVERTVLITDSFEIAGENPPEYRKYTDLAFNADGELNGSRMTMECACRNVMRHTSCGIAQAFRMASGNPARAIGMFHEVGSIAPGKRANLVLTDDCFHVKHVFLNGCEQKL